MQLDPTGRGVDALRAHALRMLGQPFEEWPHIAVMLGDQIYADDSSPATRERIKTRRENEPVEGLPPELVDGFEEYCWLYHESWSPDVERWFFSVVPTAMIFDDHDMIDDWNISDTWVRDIRQESWWERPRHRRSDVVLDLSASREPQPGRDPRRGHAGGARRRSTTAPTYLREWARSSEEFTPVPGGYRFSFARRLGDVTLVVIDARNGRVLEPGNRSIVDDDEWAWIVRTLRDRRPTPAHRVVATSVRARRHPRPATVERARLRRRVGTARRPTRRAGPAGARPGGLAGLRAIVRRPRGVARGPRKCRPALPAGDDLRPVGRHPLQLPLGPPLPRLHARGQLRPPDRQLPDFATRSDPSSAKRCSSRRREWAR